MEEKRAHNADTGGQCSVLGGFLPFGLGLVLSLLVGWWLSPKLLFSEQSQPVAFNHKIHKEEAGMTCSDCHYFREDGSYSGIPTTKECADCHEFPVGSTAKEREYVNEYVKKGQEPDWKVYQMQPDNVFFSHAAHSLENCGKCHTDWTEKELCSTSGCHPDIGDSETPPKYSENRITGYSASTMKMWACEYCHAMPDHRAYNANNNACFTCHK